VSAQPRLDILELSWNFQRTRRDTFPDPFSNCRSAVAACIEPPDFARKLFMPISRSRVQLLKAVILFVTVVGLTACGSTSAPWPPSSPAAPIPAARATLVVFKEAASGFATNDLRDAQDQILQFNTAGELIWTPDGRRLPGYWVQGTTISGRICDPECWFEVRFGTKDGERRAYLTVDYGHSNPDTLVDIEVVGGALVVTQTQMYVPGTFMLSGRVTELTAGGEIAVEGAHVYRGVGGGWREAVSDSNGDYRMSGMFASTDKVDASKPGYEDSSSDVAIAGDTRFDIRLVRKTASSPVTRGTSGLLDRLSINRYNAP
jgi:carboxypeptidase family protein